MSTSIKSTKTHTAATNAKSGVNISRPKTITVLDIIRRTIQSELQPDKKQYVLCGQDGESPRYRAEFAFKGDLRTYLKLQNQASGEKRKFSSLISFTSACVGPDALAIPVSVYVRDTWRQNGTKILQMIGNAVGTTESRKAFATLTQNCQVWITVNDDNLHLTIEGTRPSFVGVLEQICWFVSVAGDTAIDRLKNYVEETKQGTTTREYTETVYTGRPVIRPGHGCCFNVSFRAAEIEKRASRVLVEDSGHCWKTMTGLSIIASGFAIPPRPRNGSGLDASLPVLRQLIKRGCRGASPLALDKPMVVFHPRKVDRIDKSDQGSAIKLRYILAAGFEQPLRKRGNVIYWHFDPAKVCNSLGSLEQLEKRIRVEPSAIDPNSRHFVGWTSHAGHLAAAPKDIPLGVHSRCVPCPHYQLVISTFSATARLPGPLSFTAGVSAEKNDIKLAAAMLADRQQKLHHVTARLFVLWDKHLQRGWLVGGDTVALYLLRRYAKTTEDSKLKNFDFMSLKNLGYSGSSAYKVLAELNAKAFEAEKKKAEKEKKKAEKEKKKAEKEKKKTEKEKKKTEKEKTEEEEKEEAQEEKESIGPYLDEIYALALELTEKTPELNKTHALSTPFQMWFDRKFSTTITGADFDELTGNQSPPRVYTYKMKKDPGWIKWTKEEGVTFVFASGLGEVMEPKAGSCCPHFPTLPAGENLLASELRVLKRLITKYAADGSCFPPDKTVARLSHNQGWERRSDPFLREKCHGDHLSTLEPSCFPVQGTRSAKLLQDTGDILKKDVKLLKGKALYTVKEVNDMIDKNPDGVVVFGRQPGPEELGDISRRSRQRSQSEKEQTVVSTPTAAQSLDRPSSRGSGSGSTAARPLPTPGTEQNCTDRSSSSSAQRTPSMSSIRSTNSNAHPTAPQGNGTGTGQPQASTSRSPATSVHKAASIASLRSTRSNTHPKAMQGSSTCGGQPQSSASQSPAASMHRVASNTSLRSTSSTTRSIAANNGAGRSHESSAAPNAQTATRKPSNASIRTTSSVASRATDGSQPQKAPAQPSDVGLKKTSTNSSDKTSSSHSSRVTQNLAAFNSNRQRQLLLEQVGNMTAAASNQAPGQPASSNHGTSSKGTTENPHSTSSGPAPTAAGGPDVSS